MAMITKPEEVVTCPFDEAHIILKERLQFHLAKCAYANGIKKSKIVSCPFNSVHKLPGSELIHHMTICEDRKKIETFTQSLEDTTPMYSIPLEVEKPTENWDSVTGKTYRPNAVVFNKPVLLNLQGVTPSERKAFRAEERRRLKKYEEEQNKENKVENIVGYVRQPKTKPKSKEVSALLMQEFENLSVNSTSQESNAGNSDEKNPFEDKDGFVVPRYSRKGRGRSIR